MQLRRLSPSHFVLQGGVKMTEQEAIGLLFKLYPAKDDKELREAFDLAINALRTVSDIQGKNGRLTHQV